MYCASVSANRLIASFPSATFLRWEPQFKPVELRAGQVVYEPGVALDQVYFPTTSVVSLLHVMQDGEMAEIATVGHEGLVGVALFLGGTTFSRGVVQSGGEALMLPARALLQEFQLAGPAMQLLLRYTHALMTQMTQTAACNRHHTIEQQLCRWILLSLDRMQGDELMMTQELLASMLGVRREGVTAAATKLQRDGLIRYARGRITILDRKSIEQRSCECYGAVKKSYALLLPEPLMAHTSCAAPVRELETRAFAGFHG